MRKISKPKVGLRPATITNGIVHRITDLRNKRYGGKWHTESQITNNNIAITITN